jgi:hypothetical protein
VKACAKASAAEGQGFGIVLPFSSRSAAMKCDVVQADDAVYLAFEFDRKLDGAQVEQMAQMVERAIDTHDELRLLLDMRNTEEFAVGAFVSPKGLLASIKSIGPVKRYAVVGAPKIAEAAVETFGKLLPLESRAFAPEEMEQARIWVTRPLADQQ